MAISAARALWMERQVELAVYHLLDGRLPDSVLSQGLLCSRPGQLPEVA